MSRLFGSAASSFVTLAGFGLLLVARTPANAQPSLTLAGETVITQEMMRSHGITRLHDIFWLVDGARLSTIDDFSYTANISGVGRSDQNYWRVFVDGLPENLGDWGVQNLDWLSLPLHDIDSVKVVASPGLVDGLQAPWGRIEIWTRPVDEPLGATAMLMAINETGDPGPFRYSREELRLANIDKSGPDGTAALSWRRNALAVRASGAVMQHIPSDVAAFSRNRAAFDTPTTPELVLRSLALSVRHERDDREHALSVRALDMDDMLFLNSVSREVPAQHRYASGGYRFRTTTSKSTSLSVLTNVSKLSVENDDRATMRPLRWDALRWTTSAQFSFENDLVVGASMLVTQIESDQMPSGSEAGLLAAVNMSIDRPMADFSGFLSTDGKRVGFLASGRRTFAIWGAHSLAVVGAATRLVNEEIGSSEYWTIRGLRVDPDTPIEVEDAAGEAWLVYARADWRYSLEKSWFSVGVSPRVMVDGTIERNEIRWVGPAFEVEAREIVRPTGGVLSLSAAAGTRWANGRVGVRVDRRIRFGDRSYRSMDRTIPQTSARLKVDYDVAPSFWISAIGWYYSGTTWEDYESATATTDRYASSLGEFVRVDLSATKGLWRNQIDFSVSLRNVFGSDVVLHPIGALLDRALSARLRVDI